MVRAALLLGWLLLLLAALVAASMAWALDGGPGVTDFVKNGDFEDGVSDWEWVGGNLTTEDDPYADDTVGALTVTSPVAFVYQTFDVIPGGSYQLSGEFVDAQGNIDFAQLNLWPYDENGDPLPLEDADPRTTPGTWSSEVFTLPCEAASADIEVAIGGTFGSVAYLDDLRLKGAPPATPCPAPTSTATTTPSLTATAPPSTTPPAGPTATPTPSATSTPGVPPTPTVPPTPSHGLLINGGFEAASDGAPLGWDTKGGLLSQTEEPVHEGEFAGAFFSATESTKWVYQTVAVEPTAWYELDAYVFQDDPWVDSVLLRISWYASPDGSGSAVATVDSLSQLDEPQDGYRHLTTGPVKAPPGVQSARVRVLLRPVSDVSALIYVDDVTFRPSAPPPVPTPTPSPTFTPTSTPTPTRTPSATPTPPAGATSVPRETATSQPSATQPPALPSPTAPPGQATPSHGLLVNGSFEAVEEGQLVGWRKHGGVLAQVDGPARSGGHAAGFFSSTTSTKWMYQTVEVTPANWYEFDAYVHMDDPHVEAALLRISWYASNDGSGTAVDTADSTSQLEQPEVRYRYLTTGSVRAPPGVHSASVRVLLRPRSEASALIYVDDASFRPASPAPVEAEEALDGGGGGGTRKGATGSRSGSSGRSGGRSSSVAGVSGRAGARPAVIEPQPTPLIQRNPLLAPAGESSGGVWWPWALAGGAAFVTAAGAGAYWWERRRGAGRRAGSL